MSAKVIARVLLTLGFLAASLGYSSWTAQRTFFDPKATQGATQALLATPAVKTMLTRELHTALQPLLAQANAAVPAKPLGPKAQAAKARAAKAAQVKLNAAIDAAVSNPKFIGAFEQAITSLHKEILSGDPSQVTLDSTAVTNALNSAFARIDPKLAPKAKKLHTVSVPIGGADLPHIGDLRHNVTVVGDAAIAIALLLVGGALLLAHDRKMFRRTGRRIAFLALPPVLVFLVIPRALESSHNSAMSVSAAMLRSYGHRVLFSAAVFAVVGASTWLIALAPPKRRSVEPAVPPTSGETASPSLPDARIPSGEPVGLPETVFL
jgi:hypothetical protein